VNFGFSSARPRPSTGQRYRFPVVVAAIAAACATAVPLTLLASNAPASAYPTSTVVLSGHGYGHGIGMGQWGSLGYALGDDGGAGNFTYSQILTHYYGGTTLATLGTAPAPAAAHGGNVLVAMTENDGGSLVATAAAAGGMITVPGGTTAPAVEMVPNAGFTSYSIFTGPGCSGPWTLVGGPVTTATTSAVNPSDPIDLCEAGSSIEVHGTLTALFNSIPSSRVVNTLPLEQYVADVAPSESPTSWSTLGGAGPQNMSWGFQQSEAQTVAARSYVEANPMGYGGYADTCDQTCQTYPGMKNESLASIAAALDTAGQVMVTDNTSTVATTEYSASSGGWTAGAQFPAVVDAGDAICASTYVCNPNHDWTDTLQVSAIDAAYPAIGTLSAINITSRDGNGDFGGRVDMLTLTGSGGSVSLTGSEFAGTFGLKSNWFTLGTATGTPAPNPGSGGLVGYWMDSAQGDVYDFGSAGNFGGAGAIALNQPVVGMAATADSAGYWLVATDGGIFSYGDAHFWGSTGAIRLNKPIVGMATTPDGKGYWLVASDGGVFSFGDAHFWGSTGAIRLNKPIVGMVPTHDGGGYFLVASDGGVFAFGDAVYHGSLGAAPPASPVVQVAPKPDGTGYWLVSANGTVYPFGTATTESPVSNSALVSSAKSPMTSIVSTATGQGYIMVDSSGQVFCFGDAPDYGDVAGSIPGYPGRIVGVAPTPG
jgi:SpoIID/LytB domain protein